MKTTEPNIFDYHEYSRYLRDNYEHLRDHTSWFSYRFIQDKTGVDPGYMVKVFQGKKNIAQKVVPKFVKMLKLGKSKAEYFEIMVLFAKAKSNQDTKMYFEKMLSFSQLGAKKVEKDSYEYYQEWYYAAVRQILKYYPFEGDFEALGKMTEPSITTAQAKKAIRLLISLGFIRKSKDTLKYELVDQFLTTGEKWKSIAIRKFQQDTIMLAHKALDMPKENRDISTVTMTLSEDGLKKAKAIVSNFRSQMLELANKETEVNKAYHVNIQVIPIGKSWKKG